jgi:predicted amidophosphoribosyltransferase
LSEHIERTGAFATLFGPTTTLVPIPRSTPLVQGALWPAQKICDALMLVGVAAQTNPLLERIRPVARSSQALPGERPGVSEHYASFTAHRRIDVTDRIVLVDDVVTKGSTAIAAASRIIEAYPETSVQLFAVIRTKGMVPDIDRIFDPTFGHIRRDGDEADRQP